MHQPPARGIGDKPLRASHDRAAQAPRRHPHRARAHLVV